MENTLTVEAETKHLVSVKPIMRNGKSTVYENARRTICAYKDRDGKFITGHTTKECENYSFTVDTDFWAKYKLVLSHKERKLNLNDARDLLDYKFMRANKEFANSMSEVNSEATFVLFDEVTEAKESNKKFDDKLKAYGYISRMSSEEKGKFLTLFPPHNKTYRVSSEVIMRRLQEEADKSPKLFCERYDDKNRVVKMLIQEMVEHRVLTLDKVAYLYGEIVIGANLELTIDFFNDLKNQELIIQLKKILMESNK